MDPPPLASDRLSVRLESTKSPEVRRLLAFPLRMLSWIATEGFTDVSNGEKHVVRVVDDLTNRCVLEHQYGSDEAAAMHDRDVMSEELSTQSLAEFCEDYGIDVP